MVQSRPSLGLLVTAGLTLRLATFSTLLSAQFLLFSCTSVLLLRMLHHQSGITGTTYWQSADEILPANRDITPTRALFLNTLAPLSENVRHRGEMNGDRRWELVGGISVFFRGQQSESVGTVALSLWRLLMRSNCLPQGNSPRSVCIAGRMYYFCAWDWDQEWKQGIYRLYCSTNWVDYNTSSLAFFLFFFFWCLPYNTFTLIIVYPDGHR